MANIDWPSRPGLSTWQQKSELIAILDRAKELNLNAILLQVRPAGAPEVEARCLAGLSLADRAGFMNIRQSVSDEGTDLWDAQTLQNLLRPLIRAIDHAGTVVEHAPPPREDAAAVVDGSWVLFMRRRLPDYQGFLERMRTLYRDQSVAVPNTLQAVVSDSPSAAGAES